MNTRYKVIPPEIGRWYWGVNLNSDYMRMEPFVKVLEINLFKLKSLPPEMVELTHGENYEGIRFRMRFRVPAIIDRWR